ncbi:MAG: hypothetical protein AB7K71_27010 [Polyangiaceae bacterium]
MNEADASVRNKAALQLAESLRDCLPAETTVSIKKGNTATQDLGSTIVLAMSAPTLVVLARGLVDYWARRAGKDSAILIKRGDLTVKLTADAARSPESVLELVKSIVDQPDED